MRRGAGGGVRRLPKSSLAPSAAADRTPSLDAHVLHPRNLDHAFSRRDSDAASLCSSRPSSIGTAPSAAAGPLPSLSDRSSQAAALRAVNAYLAPAITLRPPLPAARDIISAFRALLDHLHFPQSASFEDDLLNLLRLLSCPYKLTRSALKAPGTPHSWPPLLSVLYWLTLLARVADSLDSSSSPSHAASNDLMLYLTQSYSLYISGDDDAVASLDEEYVSKARAHAEAVAQADLALEKEVEVLEARRSKLTAGPSRREALEEEKSAFTTDVRKFEAVVESWGAKIKAMEASLVDLEKELEAKVGEGRRVAAENEELGRTVEAQVVNVRDAERMHREVQAVDHDIAKIENGKVALEEKGWELETAVVGKLDELEVLMEQCNQFLGKLKLHTDFQYILNAKGSSPAEILAPNYKTVLKPALNALAEETKMVSVSKLDESIDLQKQLQGTVKVLEEKRNLLSTLQVKTEEMDTRSSSLGHEIENHMSKCTSEAKQMKEELERKEHHLSIVEKEAEELSKVSEQRLHDALHECDEETQMCASELLQLIDSIAEYKEFMESTISGMKKDLYESADAVASLTAKMASASQTSAHA